MMPIQAPVRVVEANLAKEQADRYQSEDNQHDHARDVRNWRRKDACHQCDDPKEEPEHKAENEQMQQ